MKLFKESKANQGLTSLILFALLLLIIAGCKSKEPTPQNEVDSKVALIKEKASSIIGSPETKAIINETRSVTQTVFVPIPSSEGQTISATYKSSCLLENYRGLQIWCKSKDFWHNQSTLLSWYVSYSMVLLALVIALFVIWLIRRNKG